ncbi:MAG: FAD-dependent oxidoreductase, partial [Myxococcales bacterium]|nr:FAD-dependent oxidoreductase [Myxococcales bacterium]
RTVLGAGPGVPPAVPMGLLDAIGEAARRMLQGLTARDHGMRRLWEVIELVLAILRGVVRFGLAVHPQGFDAIDDYDWREWLAINGASEASLRSAFMRGIYNLCMAYEGGDEARPALSAACALRGSVRMFFGYRGTLFWRMTSGMGDVVFAPIYEVLRRRGVRFEFFHRLEHVELAAPQPGAGTRVAALHFDVQAELAGEAYEAYEPLVDVRGLPCWPSQPCWSQLRDGPALREAGWDAECWWDRTPARRRVLRADHDFDVAVLAVGLGAVAPACRELVAREPRWHDMVTRLQAVATQAFQVWMRADMRQLGWAEGPINLAGFKPPFETWSDMRHLLPEESWPEPPRSLAYFCSVLPTPAVLPDRDAADYPERRRREVHDNAAGFLDRDIGHLWPQAVAPEGGFRWEELVDPGGSVPPRGAEPREAAPGPERLATQFLTANVQPTGYYTLSLPGTSRYRISPLDSTIENLRVAGDWTESGLNTACIEGAVMSGRLAAHAIAGSPRLESIVGYDHP